MNKIAAVGALLLGWMMAGCNNNSSNAKNNQVGSGSAVALSQDFVKNKEVAEIYDGPFGIKAGMPIKEIEKFSKPVSNDTGLYESTSPPSPNARFDDYRIVATPKAGLCKVVAFTSKIIASAYGEPLVGNFDELRDSLSKKYGVPAGNFNFLRGGSIWKESRDFMMSLLKGERTFAAYWVNGKDAKPKNSTVLPNELNSVSLNVVMISSESAIIKLTYEFKNQDDCISEIKAKQDKSL